MQYCRAENYFKYQTGLKPSQTVIYTILRVKFMSQTNGH